MYNKFKLAFKILICATLVSGCASKPFPRLSDDFNDAYKKCGAPVRKIPEYTNALGRRLVTGWTYVFEDKNGNIITVYESGTFPGGFAP